jgi:DNA-binding CsgD family transcriptional regulator/tetratricopeptide (TPR) repeat protein
MHSEVLALHHSGRFGEAMSMLDRSNATDPPSLLLRARISVELSASGAVGVLQDPRFSTYSLRDRAEAAMLHGRAYSKLGEYNTAEDCFDSARARLTECVETDDALSREIDHSLGMLMIAQSRVDEADRIANALLSKDKVSTHAATYVLLSRVAALREQHEKNAGYLLEALRVISTESRPDVPLWAETLHRLAVVLLIVASPAVHEAVTRHASALPWTEELADLKSKVYRLLGTRAVVEGSISEGLALLKRASTTRVASLSNRIGALLTHAEISKWLGEPFAFEEYLLEATVLAEQVNWREVHASAREILLQLAEMHARRDSALALSFAAHFESLGGFGADTRSTSAQQNYCLGLLNAEIGETGRGIAMLEAAYGGFVAVGLDWSAGQCAIILAENTDRLIWRTRARDCLAPYPNSYLKHRLAGLDRMDGASVRKPKRAIEDPRLASLTPAQLIVYRRLLEDVSVKEIAAGLNRSDLTVRNHIQAIFKKFGVNSRADLIGVR